MSQPIDNTRIRFRDAQWLKNPLPLITVGGVGGIGSWLVLFLSRIGFPMTIYDMDTIDETNLGGQAYDLHDVGSLKISAIERLTSRFSNHYDIITNREFTEEDFVTPFTIACFDNMKSRKLMFEKWKNVRNKELFIDGRMLAESFQIYCVTSDRIEDYEKTLFDDSEVADLACSFKATSHCGAMISSNITSLITNYITNKNVGFTIRNLPFNINMEISLMKYEVND